uniref:Uncharacterized protein n=1 Tax=Anguilla anguilla TaxID=7936 RepID=A0A0E9S878_ANGAN
MVGYVCLDIYIFQFLMNCHFTVASIGNSGGFTVTPRGVMYMYYPVILQKMMGNISSWSYVL